MEEQNNTYMYIFIYIHIYIYIYMYVMYMCNSLNSLSVRVPHNLSRRVFPYRTPNPLLVAGGWWLVAGGGWVYKQYLSASLLVKPMVFQWFRWLVL